MIQLRAFGPLSLASEDGREASRLVGQPRRMALLAYLAIAAPHGCERREQLLSVFWPELDDGHARAALRQALHVLRTTLGADAFVRHGDLQIGLDRRRLWCDVAAFDAAVAEDRLPDALTLYRGTLLDGFHVDDAPEFERRMDEERTRCSRAALRCATTLADRCELRRDLDAAVEWARLATRLAPGDEAVARRCMELMHAAGNPGGALQVYDALAAELRREYDVAPDRETSALREVIRAGVQAPPRPRPRSWSPVSHRARRMVGRGAIEQELRNAFAAAADGQGSIVCLAGEAGIGKTALAEQLLGYLAASDRPLRLAWGRCTERLAGTEAYLPVLESLAALCESDGGAGMAGVSGVAALARRVAPTWYARLLGVGDASSNPPEATSDRLNLEFTALISALTQDRPMVLVFDDVQWIDPSSIGLLAHLGPRLAGMRLLLILAYRNTEAHLAGSSLLRLLWDLQSRGVCREIALPFLTREDIREYLDLEYSANDFPGGLAELIYGRTEGNPLFMVDIVRWLRESGAVVQHDGRWTLTDGIPALAGGLPQSIRGMIERKLALCGEDGRTMLTAASVQGDTFDSAILADVVRRTPADVEERLDVLERVHGLVRRVNVGELPDHQLNVRYRFVHVLYQNALHGALAPSRQVEVSGATARSLLAHYGEQVALIAPTLASLLEAAREPLASAEHYAIAAEQARTLSANHEAAALCVRGTDVLRQVPPSPERDRRELSLTLCLALARASTAGWSAAEVEDTWTRARALGEGVADTTERFAIHAGLWRVCLLRARLEAACEMGQELLRLAEGSGRTALRVEACVALAYPLNHRGRHAEALEYVTRGLAIYQADPQPARSLHSLCDAGLECHLQGARSLWVLGYPDRALALTRQSLELARRLGEPHNVAWAHLAAGIERQLRREPEQALAHWDEVLRLSHRGRLAQFIGWGHTWHGWVLAMLGEREEGLRELHDGLQLLREIGTEHTVPQCHALLAEVLIGAGCIEEALATIDDALALIERTDARYYEAELCRLRGVAMQGTGALAPHAEHWLRRSLDVATTRGARSFALRSAASLARLQLAQGRSAEARDAVSPVIRTFAEGFDTLDYRDACALLAECGGTFTSDGACSSATMP